MTTLESFVNTIRNLYQQTAQSSSDSQQKPSCINYLEVFNTINSNLEVFNENSNNLLDNILPVFTLPEFTLPNMAVLYAIINKSQQQQQHPNLAQARPMNEVEALINLADVNQDKLLTELQNCLQNADENQVNNKNNCLIFFKLRLFNSILRSL